MLQSYADGTLVYATAVVGRPVDWVDNPCPLMGRVLDVFLLAQKAATGEQFGQPSAQKVLHGDV